MEFNGNNIIIKTRVVGAWIRNKLNFAKSVQIHTRKVAVLELLKFSKISNSHISTKFVIAKQITNDRF